MNEVNQNTTKHKLVRLRIITAIVTIGLVGFLFVSSTARVNLLSFIVSTAGNPKELLNKLTTFLTDNGKSIKIYEGWRVYNNSKYGVSLQYPKEYRLFEMEQLITFQTPSENNLDIYIFSDESATIADYLKKADEAAQTGYEGKPSFEVRSTKEISINGQNCVQREEHVLAADLQRTITYCLNNSTVVAIAFIPTPGKVVETDESIYQQLLSTLVFSK